MRKVPGENSRSDFHSEPVDHQRVVALLATKCALPIEEVTRLYKLEWTTLEATARIKDFITILTIRRVRDMLRGGAVVSST